MLIALALDEEALYLFVFPESSGMCIGDGRQIAKDSDLRAVLAQQVGDSRADKPMTAESAL